MIAEIIAPPFPVQVQFQDVDPAELIREEEARDTYDWLSTHAPADTLIPIWV